MKEEIFQVAFEGFPGEVSPIPVVMSETNVPLNAGAYAVNATTTAQFYPVNHYNNTNGVHGFMFERANNFIDLLYGREAYVVGGDNQKFGADRLVDGTSIQSKAKDIYGTLKSLFDAYHDFGYKNPDDSPMKIEVPKDQVERIKDLLRKKIAKGCTGIKVSEVDSVVIPGHYTYKEVIEMCQAGTYKGFVYDINTGLIPACGLGILAFWTEALSDAGKKPITELPWKNAFCQSSKESLEMLVTHVTTSQLDRTGIGAIFVGMKDFLPRHAPGTTSTALKLNKAIPRKSMGMGVAWMGYATMTAVEVARGDMSYDDYCDALMRATVSLRAASIGLKVGGVATALIPGVGPLIGGVMGIIGSMIASNLAGFLMGQLYKYGHIKASKLNKKDKADVSKTSQ